MTSHTSDWQQVRAWLVRHLHSKNVNHNTFAMSSSKQMLSDFLSATTPLTRSNAAMVKQLPPMSQGISIQWFNVCVCVCVCFGSHAPLICPNIHDFIHQFYGSGEGVQRWLMGQFWIIILSDLELMSWNPKEITGRKFEKSPIPKYSGGLIHFGKNCVSLSLFLWNNVYQVWEECLFSLSTRIYSNLLFQSFCGSGISIWAVCI